MKKLIPLRFVSGLLLAGIVSGALAAQAGERYNVVIVAGQSNAEGLPFSGLCIHLTF